MIQRRSSDPDDADFRDSREYRGLMLRPRNGHTKWVVGVVSMAIVASLGTLVGLDRANIVRTGENALAKATANDKSIEVLATDVKGQLSKLDEDVGEIKALLKEQAKRR